MFRGCVDGSRSSGPAVSFFEFKWSYMFLDAYLNSTLWPSSKQYAAFASAYEALPPTVIGEVNTDDWLAAAGQLVSLCRAKGTGSYQVPVSVFPSGGYLPGYVQGYVKLDADPTCDAPTCS